MQEIWFVGLGAMGQGMAANLIKAGHKLRVWNRTREKAAGLLAAGAAWADHPAAACPRDGIVLSMLADDKALRETVEGEAGILAGLGRGAHVSMATVSPEIAAEMAGKHAAQGATYLAAPVFGRPEAAAAAKLFICLAGPAAGRARVKPVLEVLGQRLYEFGDQPGAANVVKLCGNFMIGAAIEAMGEALALAEKSGLPREEVARMFGESIFACPIYQNYGALVASQKFQPAGFKLSLGLKDMALVLQASKDSQTPMPLANLAFNSLLPNMAKGRQDWDWSALSLAAQEAALG